MSHSQSNSELNFPPPHSAEPQTPTTAPYMSTPSMTPPPTSAPALAPAAAIQPTQSSNNQLDDDQLGG